MTSKGNNLPLLKDWDISLMSRTCCLTWVLTWLNNRRPISGPKEELRLTRCDILAFLLLLLLLLLLFVGIQTWIYNPSINFSSWSNIPNYVCNYLCLGVYTEVCANDEMTRRHRVCYPRVEYFIDDIHSALLLSSPPASV